MPSLQGWRWSASGFSAYLMSRPKTVSVPANVTIQASDTAGFRGYIKGSESAPVEITEFADYQCPFCQTFATLQMPTIEERLIRTGRLRWRYRDFPLQQHQFARLAAHSAACADEQGKYWEQHDRIYQGQGEWARGDAADHFRDYARAIGLDLGRYDECMKSGKYRGPDSGQLRGRDAARRGLDPDASGRRPAVSGQDRFRRDRPTGGLPGPPRHQLSLDPAH